MKVEIDVIVSIIVSPVGRAVCLVIMYVKNLKTVLIVFIGNVVMHLDKVLIIIEIKKKRSFSFNVKYMLQIYIIKFKLMVCGFPHNARDI
jgi:hypothetical protein